MLTNLNLCLDAAPTFFGYFDLSIAPPLLLYAYIPIFLLSMFFGFFIITNDKKSKINRYFLGITTSFSVWILLVLIQWVGVYLEVVQLAWQLLILPEILIFLFSVLFIYSFVLKKNPPILVKVVTSLIIITVALVLPTTLNINSFDLSNCEGVIGSGWSIVYLFELIAIVFVVLIALERILAKIDKSEKIKSFLVSFGTVIFLSIFWGSNYFAEITKTYEINLIGPIGMILFLGLVTYSIVRFNVFNIKLLGIQALMFSLCFSVLGILFIGRIQDVHIVALVTLTLVVILGYLLIQGVKKEIQQKEELVKLNKDLENLLKQRESLVHLVTHKVKGSFTRSKYIFATILDGTFGEISNEIRKISQQGMESDNIGIETVDLVLNVSNMQKGTVKYDMKQLNLKEVVDKVIAEKKIYIEERGLKLDNQIKDGVYNINGDVFWLKEAINNLVDNAIKYTRAGVVTVNLENKDGKIILSVRDTGVGITDEDKPLLFTEGGRGKNSLKVNIDSTGYGLYSVKLIADAHKGRVWAESEGADKGSTFYMELTAV